MSLETFYLLGFGVWVPNDRIILDIKNSQFQVNSGKCFRNLLETLSHNHKAFNRRVGGALSQLMVGTI